MLAFLARHRGMPTASCGSTWYHSPGIWCPLSPPILPTVCEAYQSSPRYQWGLWSSERLSNLSQNTQQTCHRTETKTQILLMPFPRHCSTGHGASQETSHPPWGWRRRLCGASATQARIRPPDGLPGVGGWELVVSFGQLWMENRVGWGRCSHPSVCWGPTMCQTRVDL